VPSAICVGWSLSLNVIDSHRPLPNCIDVTAPAALYENEFAYDQYPAAEFFRLCTIARSPFESIVFFTFCPDGYCCSINAPDKLYEYVIALVAVPSPYVTPSVVCLLAVTRPKMSNDEYSVVETLDSTLMSLPVAFVRLS
jgi:hypothetical protein